MVDDWQVADPVEYRNALDALGDRLHARVGRAGDVVVNHPAELRLLRDLGGDELVAFAHAHGLNVVRRGHGSAYEFTHRGGGH